MEDLYNDVLKAQQEEGKETVFSSSLFQEYLRTKLIQLISSVQGEKHLIFDDSVKIVLNLSLDNQTLKSLGVMNISNIMNTYHENISHSKVLIFVQPKVEYLDRIKEYVDKEAAVPAPNKKGAPERVKKEFTVVYWPKRTTLCKEAQSERKISDEQIKIIDFSFDLIPIDQDVLSLEMPDTFTSMYLDSDFSTYAYVAESIQRLQIIYGKIPNVFYKGEGPSIVMEILNAEEDNGNKANADANQSEFETMIILDRNLDFITPLCSQLTYEGLIDDTFGITANLLKVDGELIGGQKGKIVPVKLSSENNSIYQAIRDKQVSQSREVLNNKAQYIQRAKEIIQSKKSQSTPEEMARVLKIVEKITRDQKQVEDHVNLSCSIIEKMRTIQFYKDLLIEQSTILGVSSNQALDYIEMLIGLGEPIQKVLRLFCLQSLVDNGIKPKQFDELRKEIIQEYGIKHLLTLQRLQQIGLLKRQDGSKNLWPKLKEVLKLVDEEVEIENPTDPAYAFSGYCPLTIRLVEHALKKQTWKHIGETLKIIPGAQDFPQEASKYVKVKSNKPAVLVYIIGGITYGEIAALRLLAAQTNKEIVIASTQLINSKKMLSALIESTN